MEQIAGVVQHYEWGDHTYLPEFLGRQPDGRPWAELWLGTHASGPSRLADGRLLEDESGALPYLFKVLAAAEPLSLQTHPDAEQARSGFATGRFRDPYPKPELLCALTPFEGLCGVRPPDETAALLDELGLNQLRRAFEASGVAETIRALLGNRVPLGPVVAACERSERPEARWVVELAQRWPEDPAIIVTLLLNHVELEPGEAIALGAGNLHAYLRGVGVELMAPSDNVVRAGLTTKPVDIDLLLDVMDPTPLLDPVLSPATRYELAGTTVALLRLVGPAQRRAKTHELAILSTGRTGYLSPGSTLDIEPGVTAYIATS